jgi:hypothetical protein
MMRMIQVSKFDQGHCILVIFNCEFCLMEMLEKWLLFFLHITYLLLLM